MGALLWLGLMLVAAWLVAVVAFKVVGFGIHFLLFAAVIALITYFVRRSKVGTPAG
jgi:hypothetical protein